MSNNNNNVKMPKGFILGFFLVFFGGMALSIGGTVANDSTVSTIGMVTLFGGTLVMIIIANAVLSAKRRKAAEDRLKALDRQSDGDADDDIDSDTDDEPIWEGTDDKTALLEGELKMHDLGYVMDREDALCELFDRLYLGTLEDEYNEQAEKYWDRYDGDDWDDNLEAIDLLIDEFYARVCMRMVRKTAASEETDNAAVSEQARDEEKAQAVSSLAGVLSAVADKAETTEEHGKANDEPSSSESTEERSFAFGAHETEATKRATVGYKGIKKK